MNEHRDTFVGDALRRLDVPDHAQDFWSRLDTELAGGPSAVDDPAETESGADVVELGSAPSRRSSTWARRPMLIAAAVVAAVALVVGAAVLGPGGEDESQLDVAETPGDVEPTPDGTDVPAPGPSAPGTETTTAPDPGATQVTAEDLAGKWLALLRAGEVDAAHALLDESSRARLSLEEFRQVSTGLAEGAAAFAGVEPTVVPLIDDEGLAATAVVFTAEVEREGMIETASFAVVVTGDPDDPSRELGIAFVLDGPTIAAEPTAPGETRTSPLELTLSPTAGATWAIVDGSAPERIDTAGTGGATIDVEETAGAGTHTVAVISTEAGLYRSASFTVVVP